MFLPQDYVEKCIHDFQVIDEQESQKVNAYCEDLESRVQSAILTGDSERGVEILARIPAPEDPRERLLFNLAYSSVRQMLLETEQPLEDWVREYAANMRWLDEVSRRTAYPAGLSWSARLVDFLPIVSSYASEENLCKAFIHELRNGGAVLTFPTLCALANSEWWLNSVVRNVKSMFADQAIPLWEAELVLRDVWFGFIRCHAVFSAAYLALSDESRTQNTIDAVVGLLFRSVRDQSFSRLALSLDRMLESLGQPQSDASQADRTDHGEADVGDLSYRYLTQASAWVAALTRQDREATVKAASQLLECARALG